MAMTAASVSCPERPPEYWRTNPSPPLGSHDPVAHRLSAVTDTHTSSSPLAEVRQQRLLLWVKIYPLQSLSPAHDGAWNSCYRRFRLSKGVTIKPLFLLVLLRRSDRALGHQRHCKS